MKRRDIILIVLATMLCCSTSRASITSASWWDDGDGALLCSDTSWNPGTGVLSMSGNQYWAPGHMLGTVKTDTEQDPTLTLATGINNDSSFAWTAFTVNVYMNNTFTLTNAAVTAPVDWTVVSVSPVTYTGSNYVGTILFDTGTPIPNDNVSELDFSYQLHFSGGTSYSFTQEMIPVPEPSTVALVAMGGLLFARFTLRRGRK
jgi:hypothetical protein